MTAQWQARKAAEAELRRLMAGNRKKMSINDNALALATALESGVDSGRSDMDMSSNTTLQEYVQFGEEEIEESDEEEGGVKNSMSQTEESISEGEGEGKQLQEVVEDIVGPSYKNKFRPAMVQFWIERVLTSYLHDKEYTPEEVKGWTSDISKEILACIHLLRFPRYKLIVTVVIAERTNDAVISAYRCLWDAEADCSASFSFTNETLYCVATVHGIYCY